MFQGFFISNLQVGCALLENNDKVAAVKLVKIIYWSQGVFFCASLKELVLSPIRFFGGSSVYLPSQCK